jgi:hypothetical protein
LLYKKKILGEIRRIEINIPLLIKRKKGTFFVYSTLLYSSFYLKHYLDVITLQKNIKNKLFKVQQLISLKDNVLVEKHTKKNERTLKCYVLNLRGFLLSLLLYRNLLRKNTKYYKDINEVIENLACNFNSLFIENKYTKLNGSNNILNENEESSEEIKFYIYRLTRNFSFLSYFYQYKELLPTNYAANALIEVAGILENKLDKIDLSELTYEVTLRFFEKIEKYFWESNVFSAPRIIDRKLIDDKMFMILNNYQNQTREYFRLEKEKLLKEHCEQTKHYQIENYKNELTRKVLHFLIVTDKSIIIINDIIESINLKKDLEHLHGMTREVVKDICEYYRSEYITATGDFLIKKTKVEEIKKKLKPEMTYERAKQVLVKHEICGNQSVMSEIIQLTGYRFIKDRKTKEWIII